MTVNELIALLEPLDPEAKVRILIDDMDAQRIPVRGGTFEVAVIPDASDGVLYVNLGRRAPRG